MSSRALRSLLFLGIAASAIQTGEAGQYIVVTHAPGGPWLFQEAESVVVNGKEKVRSAPLSAGAATTWESKAISHLAEVQLSSFTVVRRGPDGAILARAGDSTNWLLLLPEGSNAKTAESSPQLWSSSSVAVKKDRKDKAAQALRLEELYAIVPGHDAAALATDTSFHKLPGMSAVSYTHLTLPTILLV